MAEVIRELLISLGEQLDVLPELDEYIQVSDENQPFDDAPTVPGGALLPFIAPAGFSEEEIVEIVDFVRTSPEPVYSPNVVPVWHVDGTEPIVSISKVDGIITVETGSQEGLLCGGGSFLECQKVGSTFEVINVGFWSN